jgi:RNA polymerase-binding transcription factor
VKTDMNANLRNRPAPKRKTMPRQTKIHRNLVNKRAELTERLNRTAADMRRENAPLSRDLEDQASELENDEVLARLHDSTQQEIAIVDSALRRLEDGSYGTCTSCGRIIEAVRIAVLPEAEVCAACATGKGTK